MAGESIINRPVAENWFPFNVLLRHCQVKPYLAPVVSFPCVLLEGTVEGMYYRRHAKAAVNYKDGRAEIKTPVRLPAIHLGTDRYGRLTALTQWHTPFGGNAEGIPYCGCDN